MGPGSSGGRTMEMKDTDQSLDREEGGECPQQWDGNARAEAGIGCRQ